jgi:outer membrane receptor protein involved in Fe transport
MKTRARILAACAMIMPVALPATAYAQESTDESAGDNNEIIVTASKRDERLQDVPTAVTALSSATLENLGVTSFRDYASLVPGLSQRDSGQPGVGTIIMRGLNSGPQQTTNTAGYYIDDAPFSASGYLSVAALMTPAPELAEIERIEVLKGPQGTLYGAGSLGGLIRIVTKKPDPSRFYGNVRGEVSTVSHGEEGYMLRGTVNVPIVQDKVAISATGYYRRMPGFVDNVTTGTDNVNRNTVKGGRLALFAEPAEGLKINLAGQYQDIDLRGAAGISLTPGTFSPRYADPYSYGAFRDLTGTVKYRLASASVEYETGIGAITASGSYAKYDVSLQYDYTSVYIPLARSSLGAVSQLLFGVPIDTLLPANTQALGEIHPAAKKYSAELRFASKRLGPVEFLAGLFYTNEDSVYITNVLPITPAGAQFPAPFKYLIRATTTSKYKEAAAFGNLTFYLSDNLDVTGGIRYARNDQTSGTGGPGAISFFLPRAALTFPFKDNATTYLATARWRPTQNLSFYARAASGYRPGGPQTNSSPPVGAQTVIRPDGVWNYEAGVKGSALDGAFTFDASVYHIDWKDIQLNALVGGFVLGGNAANATVDGFELQMQARPSELLTVGANVGHTDAKLKSIAAASSAVLGARAGDRLPLTPLWTVALIADHAIPFSDDVRGNVGATLRFQSEAAATYPALNPGPTQTLPEITTLDLRAGATFGGRFTAQVRLDNVFDRLGYSNIDGSGSAVVIRPRTLSLTLGANF